MKFLYTSILLLLSCLVTIASAQTLSFSPAASSGSSGDTVTSSVVVQAFSMPESFQFEIKWDTARASYVSIVALNPELVGNNDFAIELTGVNRGSIKVTYVEFSRAPPALASPSTLFGLKLRLKNAGTSNVTVDPQSPSFPGTFAGNGQMGERDIIVANPWTLTVTGGPGNPGGGMTGTPCDGLTSPTLVFGDTVVVAGDSVCIPIYGFGLPAVNSFQFQVRVDTALLKRGRARKVNPLIAADFQFANNVALYNNGMGVNVNIPNCALLFEACFDTRPGGGGVTGAGVVNGQPAPIEFIDFPSGPIAITVDTGVVRVLSSGTGGGRCAGLNSPTVFFPDTTIAAGSSVCLPLYAYDIPRVSSFDFVLAYDAAVLRFDSFTAVLPALATGFLGNVANRSALYNSPSGTDVSLPNCTPLLQACFTAIGNGGDSSLVRLRATPSFEFADINGPFAVANRLSTTRLTDTTTMASTPCDSATGPSLVFGNGQALPGDTVCVDVYGYQISPITGFDFTLKYVDTSFTLLKLDSINVKLADGLQLNAANGKVLYSQPGGVDLTFLDCEKLFEVCLVATGSAPVMTTIGIDTTKQREFANVMNTFRVSGVDGKLDLIVDSSFCARFNGPTIGLTEGSGAIGDTVCLNLVGFDLIALDSFQFSLSANAAFVALVDTQSVDPRLRGGLVFAKATNTFTYVSPDSNGLTITGCDTLLQVCYSILGGAGDSTAVTLGGPATFRDTAGIYLPTLVAGEITIDTLLPIPGICASFTGPTLQVGTASGAIGDTICVPVIGYQLAGVTDFQIGFGQDSNLLKFTGIRNAAPAIAASLLVGLKQSRVIFNDLTGVGVDLSGCDTLFLACFVVRGGAGTVVPIGFKMPFTEVSDINGPFLTTQLPGSATVAPSSCNAITVVETLVNPRCNGEANGSITLAVSGGNGTYTYLWSDGGVTSRDRTGLAVGTYTVTVTSCGGTGTLVRSFTLSQPDVLNATGIITQPTCTIGNTGAINVSVAGGTSPYTFLWTGAGVTAMAEDQTGLAPGNYSVTATDARGCTDTESFTINAVAVVTVMGVVTDATCNGASTGAINITAAGGAVPYTYVWTGAGVSVNSEDQTGLAAGNYSVVVTDNGGCSATKSFTVGQPVALSVTGVVVQPTCLNANGGSIDITITGGTPPYVLAWTGPGVVAAQEDQTGLGAGTYRVSLTDARGCTATASFTLTAPPTVTLVGQVTNAGCSGADDGSITTTTSGGMAPYTYVWTGAGVVQNQANQTGLAAGTYGVTVKDQGGCSASASFTVGAAAGIMITATVVQPTGGQNDGSIDITPSGGSGNYAYLWTGPGVIFDNQDQFGLGAGTYTVTVSDEAGCSTMRQFVLSVGAPSVSAMATSSCNNASTGTITVTVTGGTPPFTFAWSNGLPATQNQTGVAPGNYTVTVTDANMLSASATVAVGTLPAIRLRPTITAVNTGNDGAIDLTVDGGSGGPFDFSWSNGATTEDLSGLAAGQYTVVVTDRPTGCTATGTYDVGAGNQPLQVVSTFRSVRCNASSGGSCDGEYTIDIQQGAYPVTVSFTGGATTVGLPATTVITTPGVRTFANLCPGTFNVQLVDANGATYSDTGVEIAEPTQLQIQNALIIPVIGDGGVNGGVDITVTGGTTPYMFAWTAGPNPTTEDNLGLAIGTYAVVITDANGCMLRSSNYEVRQFRINRAEVTDVACAGNATGEINIEATGGNGRYSYLWSNGATTQDIIGVTPGIYTVTVTDVLSGVSFMASYEVKSTSRLAISATSIGNFNGFQVSCAGGNDGQAVASATGANGEAEIRWSNGATGPQVNGLSPGIYTVTAKDASGCTATTTVTIGDAPLIQAEIRVDNVRCRGEDNGRLTATLTGGAGGYIYTWSNGSTDRAALRLTAGIYTLNVTDRNGCEATFTAGVTQPESKLNVVPQVTGATAVQPGRIELIITGQTPPYKVIWADRAETGPVLENLAPGIYKATISDANNCEVITLDVEVTNGSFACYEASDVLTPGLRDGLNDIFKINCIEAQTNNEVEIFNRWGQSVYRATGYNNRSVVFEGLNSSGEVLPEGGYFYVLTYRDAQDVQQVSRGSFNIVR